MIIISESNVKIRDLKNEKIIKKFKEKNKIKIFKQVIFYVTCFI